MPKNKFQEVIFTIIMVFVMVYAMICYNIVLNTGTIAFCASQWPLVRLPVATWRYEWPEVNRLLCVRS